MGRNTRTGRVIGRPVVLYRVVVVTTVINFLGEVRHVVERQGVAVGRDHLRGLPGGHGLIRVQQVGLLARGAAPSEEITHAVAVGHRQPVAEVGAHPGSVELHLQRVAMEHPGSEGIVRSLLERKVRLNTPRKADMEEVFEQVAGAHAHFGKIQVRLARQVRLVIQERTFVRQSAHLAADDRLRLQRPSQSHRTVLLVGLDAAGRIDQRDGQAERCGTDGIERDADSHAARRIVSPIGLSAEQAGSLDRRRIKVLGTGCNVIARRSLPVGRQKGDGSQKQQKKNGFVHKIHTINGLKKKAAPRLGTNCGAAPSRMVRKGSAHALQQVRRLGAQRARNGRSHGDDHFQDRVPNRFFDCHSSLIEN